MMKTVYEAQNSVDAKLIKDLLEQNNLTAMVVGEHLQGGVGELQPFGFVRVLVQESDVAKAKGLISEWESTNVDDLEVQTLDTDFKSDDSEVSTVTERSIVKFTALLIVIGLAAVVLLTR